MRMTSIITALPAPLSVAPVPECQESKCAPHHHDLVLAGAAADLSNDIAALDIAVGDRHLQIEPHAHGLFLLHEPDHSPVMLGGDDEGRRGQRIARPIRPGGLSGEQPVARTTVRGQNGDDALRCEEPAAFERHGVETIDQLIDKRCRHRHEHLEHLLRLLRPHEVVHLRHA
jgi:hypothetical protein